MVATIDSVWANFPAVRSAYRGLRQMRSTAIGFFIYICRAASTSGHIWTRAAVTAPGSLTYLQAGPPSEKPVRSLSTNKTPRRHNQAQQLEAIASEFCTGWDLQSDIDCGWPSIRKPSKLCLGHKCISYISQSSLKDSCLRIVVSLSNKAKI